MSSSTAAPGVTGFHHFSPTVSDVEASAQWYEQVFGMSRVPAQFPHNGDEDGGYAVLLMEPNSGVAIGLHHHVRNPGAAFAEERTGLDHMASTVASRSELEAWTARLDELRISHSGITDIDTPMAFSTVAFRDPDNIALELFFMPS